MPFRQDPYGTHVPVLAGAVQDTTGPVLELGCGPYSTPLLHRMCEGRRLLVTAEHNDEWRRKFDKFKTDMHLWELVKDWEAWEPPVPNGGAYGLVFVDQSPMEARASFIKRFREAPALRGTLWVIHDAQSRVLRDVIKAFGSVALIGSEHPTVTAVCSDREPQENR